MGRSKKSLKRELIHWAVIIGVIGFLYLTGLHKEVIAGFQRLVLQTGLFQPNAEKPDDRKNASYDFYISNVEGETIDFKTFENKTVFMNFWASWCPPCIAEMPDIQKLYNEMPPEEVAFVMLSLDNDFETAKAFADEKGYSFPIYQLVSALPPVYASQSIPTTFVISPEGEIVIAHEGMADYYNKNFVAFLNGLSE